MKSRRSSIQFYVEEKLHRALRMAAAIESRSMTSILIELINARCAALTREYAPMIKEDQHG